MSFAIKMVTYQEELKLLTEKINARKSRNKVLDDFKACAHAQKNDAVNAKAKPEAEVKAKSEAEAKAKADDKAHVQARAERNYAKAEAKRIQMARIARLKLITKELKQRNSKKKELDDFKGKS